jgi:hypothetical protein
VKWNIRFLRVAMWIFRLLALITVVFAVASIFFSIGISDAVSAGSSLRRDEIPLIIFQPVISSRTGLVDMFSWSRYNLPRVITGLILALIFATLSALISLNLRFYAALRNRQP